MGTIAFDNASKLEVTRRGLQTLRSEMEPIRKALHLDTPPEDQNKTIEAARQALSRVESALAEMNDAMDAQGT